MMQKGINNIDYLGRKLSEVLPCTVRYMGSAGKNVFMCDCGVMFSVSRLESSSDWSWAKEKHSKEAKQWRLHT